MSEPYGLSRDQAYELLCKTLNGANLIKHSLAAEAVMRRLASHFGEDPEKWGLAGLLHDLDAESQPDLTAHTHETRAILERLGVDSEIIEAICLHNEQAHAQKRSTLFQHALAAAETITGLIVATALVYPEKRLASVRARSVRKRMKEKQFAAGADRSIILECELIGISLDAFCEMSLLAMQEIAKDLEL